MPQTRTTVQKPAARNNTIIFVAYPDMNHCLFQGRLLFAEKVSNNQGSFIAVTLVTTTKKGDEGTSIVFNSSDLIEKFDAGWLVPGRRLTVTGKLFTVRTTYLKQGEVLTLKRPEVKLVDANIADYGALPKSANTNR